MRPGVAVAVLVGMTFSCKGNGPEVTPIIDDGYGGGSMSVGPGGGSGGEGEVPVSFLTCFNAPDGSLCPGSDDPRQAERCLRGTCVGTYVAATGSDANPGTRALPKATITAALKVAIGLGERDTVPKPVPVCVGAGDFAEDLVVPDHVDLQGGFNTASWFRQVVVHRSRLLPSDPRGVRFSAASMSRDSVRMSGFLILGAASGDDTAAVTIENGAQPTLEYLEVVGGVTPALSTAVSVIGADSRPYLANTGFTGGAASTSIGLRVSDGAAVELDRSHATGGTASLRSTGAMCVAGCPGSAFTDVNLTGGAAPESQGLWLVGGSTSGVFVLGATLRGTGLGANLMSRAVGARLTGPCTGTPATILRANITGVGDSNHHGAGVEVTDCSLDLRNSSVSGIGGGTAVTAAAVTCDGASTCTLIDNELFAASSGAEIRDTAIGVRLGGTGLVKNNLINAGKCASLVGGEATGLAIASGPMRIENNVVLGGLCETSAALAVRTMTGFPAGEPEIVNNHFDGVGRSIGFSAGVVLERPRGVFLNNTIIAGVGQDGAAFFEQEPNADPSALRNNNLVGRVLYVDDGMGLRSIDRVNDMALGPAASGNISADPQLDADLQLGPTSPNRSAGAMSAGTVLSPATDRVGHERPFPAGTNPDIGPHERD